MLVVWLSILPLESFADWQFTQRVAVSMEATEGVFHHLEGAGRKHIAVSDRRVALFWEDDSSGAPQVYLAIKEFTDKGFGSVMKISYGEEAYEPTIADLPGGRFVMVWEQDGGIYLNIHDDGLLSKPLKLSSGSPASHSSVIAGDGLVYVVWREQRGKTWHLQVAGLEVANRQAELRSVVEIDPVGSSTPVLFPSITLDGSGLYIAWEDRAAGHTRLMYSYSTDPAKTFDEPQYLNEFYSNRNEYDRGNGVTRVSIASFGDDEILSAWMDKRRSGGYGIFASLGGEGSFGPNERIHGPEGDLLPHYNPSTSGNREGMLVVAWDDYRKGDSDIWLTTLDENGEWGENFSPTPASGPGEQSHASIALDDSGGLHIVWIERESLLASSRLWYGYAVASSN